MGIRIGNEIVGGMRINGELVGGMRINGELAYTSSAAPAYGTLISFVAGSNNVRGLGVDSNGVFYGGRDNSTGQILSWSDDTFSDGSSIFSVGERVRALTFYNNHIWVGSYVASDTVTQFAVDGTEVSIVTLDTSSFPFCVTNRRIDYR